MIIYYRNNKSIIYLFIFLFFFYPISKNIYSQLNNNQKNVSTKNTDLSLKWLKYDQSGGTHGSSNFNLYDSFGSSLPSGFSNSDFLLWGFFPVKETPDVYFIKGFVKDSSGTGISDVIVYLSGDSTDTDTTSYDGNYEFINLDSRNYTVKPEKSGWSFKPSERNYNPLNSNQTDQNFTGSPDSVFPGIVDNYISLPKKYQLYQNYPNPFNPITRITFDLPKKEHVTVKIFDLRGSELIILLDEIKPAGHHELIWNGKDRLGNNVTSGLYFYKINSGQFCQIRKMILVR